MSTQKKDTQPPQWVISKLQQYCAYQERCMFDVRKKLYEFHLQDGMNESIILLLKKENYLDEARYAKFFASGKIRINHWGKIKIYAALQQKQVPEFFILQGLNEVDEQEYLEILKKVIDTKNKSIKEPKADKRKLKLATFAAQRGFESDKIWKVIGSMKF